MDAALNGLAYFTESVATPEQLLEFVSHCGEDPTELDEDSLLEAVNYYVSEDSYRGIVVAGRLNESCFRSLSLSDAVTSGSG